MDGAFEFVMDNGLCAEDDVPYDAEVHRLGCEKAGCTSVVEMSGCYDLFPSNEMLLQEAVAEQPVSVAIGADAVGFMSYSGGILTPDGCNTALDHGVLVVGYGEDNGEKYWRHQELVGHGLGRGGLCPDCSHREHRQRWHLRRSYAAILSCRWIRTNSPKRGRGKPIYSQDYQCRHIYMKS